MASLEYAERLKDPRWQKKRLEIFERDGWSCQICHDTKRTLAVHHKRYLAGREPWEYTNDYLVTLCESCHEDEKERRPDLEDDLLNMLKLRLSWLDLNSLCEGLINTDTPKGEIYSYLHTLKALLKHCKKEGQ